MGLRFRKSIKLGKHAKININKKSVGFTVGTKGMHYTVNSKGQKTTSVGIPGTGIHYQNVSKIDNSNNGNKFEQPVKEEVTMQDKVGCFVRLLPIVIGCLCITFGQRLSQFGQTAYGVIIEILGIGIVAAFIIKRLILNKKAKSTTNEELIQVQETTNNTKLKTIILSVIAIILLLCTLFYGYGKKVPKNTDNTSTPITSTTSRNSIKSFVFKYGYTNTELVLNGWTNKEKSYFDITSDGDVNENDFELVSENSDVAKVAIVEITSSKRVYFNVEAVGTGETSFYVETKDGTIRSEKISVVVTEEETTIETTTEKITKEYLPTYIVNTSTGKFHYSSCYMVDKMNDGNKKEYKCSYDDMIAKGYSPCKKCVG